MSRSSTARTDRWPTDLPPGRYEDPSRGVISGRGLSVWYGRHGWVGGATGRRVGGRRPRHDHPRASSHPDHHCQFRDRPRLPSRPPCAPRPLRFSHLRVFAATTSRLQILASQRLGVIRSVRNGTGTRARSRRNPAAARRDHKGRPYLGAHVTSGLPPVPAIILRPSTPGSAPATAHGPRRPAPGHSAAPPARR